MENRIDLFFARPKPTTTLMDYVSDEDLAKQKALEKLRTSKDLERFGNYGKRYHKWNKEGF